MKKLFVLLMTLIASCGMYGQTSVVTYTVKGVLQDSITLETEPYATLRIARKEAPDKPVKMAITKENGSFEEKITGDGDYILTITSIGKNDVVKPFTLQPTERVKDLGVLYSSEATNELQGVTVVAQRSLVKVDIDKIEYNIEDDPDSKTNSILEMLRKVPLVTVDAEDKIQVNGNSSFKVHVNGKPNNMMSDNPTEVLKSMPASSIKHIEVITNPGAKYDAEGIGGILNIVTVGSGFEGYTATFSGNASNTGYGGGLYATVQQNKLTVTGRYNYSYNDRPRSHSSSLSETLSTGDKLQSEGWSKGTGSFQHGTLEASYELDTLRLITMSVGMYGGGNNSNGQSDVWQEDALEQTIYSYTSLNHGKSSWYSIRGNIDYQRSFSKKGRLLTFSYNINTRPQTSDSRLSYMDVLGDAARLEFLRLTGNRSDGEQNTTEHTFQADYTTPIGKFHTVEGGLKYIVRNNISDNDRYNQDASDKYVIDLDRSSHYKHLNDILAGYSSYSLRYKKISGRLGLRFERTMQDVKYRDTPNRNFDVSYNDLVPSASIGFKLSDSQNIRTGYQMRIWRPGIYYLNPYYDDTNPNYVTQGNPNIETEKSHAFNLSYSSFTAKFNVNLTLSYSVNNNAIEQVTVERNAGTAEQHYYTTYENIGKNRRANLSGYVNWNASPKTRVYANLYGTYNDLRSPSRNLNSYGWNAFVYGGVQHTLPWELRLSLNVYGSTPQTSLQGRYGGFSDYSLGLNRSFLDKRLTVSAFAGNIFSKYRSYTNTTIGPNFKTSMAGSYPARRFGVSVSYRIGELKATVKKAARTIHNDDVKSGGEGGGQGDNN